MKKSDRIDQSSAQTRNLSLVFTGLVCYVVVAIASISHLDLLVPGSGITLPLIGFDVPVVSFGIIAPILIVGVHLHLLFSLREHAFKLRKHLNNKDGMRWLRPFVFNYFFVLSWTSPTGFIMKSMTLIVLVVLPPAAIAYSSISFLPYHSLQLTSWINAWLSLDIFAVWLFSHMIFEPDWSTVLKKHHRRANSLLRVLMQSPRQWPRGLRKLPVPYLRFLPKALIAAIIVFYAWKLLAVPISNVELVPLTEIRISDILDRNLKLPNCTLVASPPQQTIILQFLRDAETSEKEAWIGFAQGLDLSDRDLRFADFSQSKFWNANFSSADLSGANLSAANLSHLTLDSVNFTGCYAKGLDLSGSKIRSACFRGATLAGSKLVEANFRDCDLAYSSMKSANGKDVSFASSNLRGCDLNAAELAESYWYLADLSCSNLYRASLVGASMEFVNLDWTNLAYCQFTASELHGVSNQGALLRKTSLACVTSKGIESGVAFLDSINWSDEFYPYVGLMYKQYLDTTGSFEKWWHEFDLEQYCKDDSWRLERVCRCADKKTESTGWPILKQEQLHGISEKELVGMRKAFVEQAPFLDVRALLLQGVRDEASHSSLELLMASEVWGLSQELWPVESKALQSESRMKVLLNRCN